MEEKERYIIDRFENANGTWYSRESCRDLTNEEVFEELRTELRQFADLEAKLAESEEEHELLINQFEEETEKLRKQIKQESDARKRFVEEVKNLKQQLAESEKKNFELVAKLNLKEHKPAFCILADRDCEALGQIERLKQQLAEKDKEISEYIKIVDDLHKQLSDKCDFCDKTKDQDKISFAVEQLEKVKEFVNDIYGEYSASVITNFIDNQIKELKGK